LENFSLLSGSCSEAASNIQAQEEKGRLLLSLIRDGKKIQKDQQLFTLVKIPLVDSYFLNFSRKAL